MSQALALHSLFLVGKRILSLDRFKSVSQALVLHSLFLVGKRILSLGRFKSARQSRVSKPLRPRNEELILIMKSKRSLSLCKKQILCLSLLSIGLAVKEIKPPFGLDGNGSGIKILSLIRFRKHLQMRNQPSLIRVQRNDRQRNKQLNSFGKLLQQIRLT